MSEMEFAVRRRSEWDATVPPCPGAVRRECKRVERRTCLSPEEFDQRFAEREGRWLSMGTDHRTWQDTWGRGIARDLPSVEWFIDFASVGEFMQFLRDNGECIVSADGERARGYPHLDIYDEKE